MSKDGPLYEKFEVTRIDKMDRPGGKHDGCEYFVLDIDHDPHALPALLAYSYACTQTHPMLAEDLQRLVLVRQAQRSQARNKNR